MRATRSLSGALIDRAIAWTVAQTHEPEMLAVRRAFEARTGEIHDDARDYEARIGHFWEQLLCSGSPAPLARFAAHDATLTLEERVELAGWLRSHRSLFALESAGDGAGVLRDCVLGGRFRISLGERDQKLEPSDRFDARLLALGGELLLTPGRVFHPPEAREALDALLARVDRDALPSGELLDALLLMRSRFKEFASVRAEHVYHERALAPVRLPLLDPNR